MKRERLEEFNGWWFTGKVPLDDFITKGVPANKSLLSN